MMPARHWRLTIAVHCRRRRDGGELASQRFFDRGDPVLDRLGLLTQLGVKADDVPGDGITDAAARPALP